jgi:hypothetical protein
MCDNGYVSEELKKELEKISNCSVGAIDWKKYNREKLKRQKIYQILKEYEEIFGVCDLSLCDEHEKMQCKRCKFKSFLRGTIGNLIEEFYKYEDEYYGAQENNTMQSM